MIKDKSGSIIILAPRSMVSFVSGSAEQIPEPDTLRPSRSVASTKRFLFFLFRLIYDVTFVKSLIFWSLSVSRKRAVNDKTPD